MTYEGLGASPAFQLRLPQGCNVLPLHLLGALGAYPKGLGSLPWLSMELSATLG